MKCAPVIRIRQEDDVDMQVDRNDDEPIAPTQESRVVYEIGPLQDFPANEKRSWKELIGFDPIEECGQLDIEKCYNMKIWARTGQPLRPLPLPEDPLDNTRALPHKAIISDKIPVDIWPENVLLEWLYFHGVPMPKSSSKAMLIEKVKLALAVGQELDRERISLANTLNRKSYISWENMVAASVVYWNDSGEDVLNFLRSAQVPKVDEEYIMKTFGAGIRMACVREHGKDLSVAVWISTP